MRNLKRLEYYVAVAEELHFGRAAERLFIAQPGLSQQVKLLEKELGVQLLERDRRSVELTPAGALLLEEGRALLHAADELEARIKEAAAGRAGSLTVAHTRSAADLGLFELLHAFRATFPDVEVHSTTAWTERNLELLTGFDVDVAFVRTPIDISGVESVVIFDEELVLAVPAGHPLGSHDRVRPEEVQTEPVVLWPRAQGPGYYDTIVGQVWRDSPPNIVLEEPEAELILPAVASGIGVAVLDRRRAEKLCPPGVTLVRFAEPVPTAGVGLAWRIEDLRSTASLFVEFIQDHVCELPDPASSGRT